MKLSVCTESVFKGLDTVEAMGRVKAAGYSAFEFWDWWNKDIAAISREKQRLDLDLVLFCTRFHSLVDPGQHPAYLEGLGDSLAAARQLDCPLLVTQAGPDTGAPREEQRAGMIAGLEKAAPLLEAAGVTLLLEPLNLRDHPDNFLVRAEEAAEIIAAVGSPRVGLLFDLYHQQVSQGDVLNRLERCLPHVRHLHCAGNPGRHELYRGELDYRNIFAAVGAMGYTGHLGLEYFPLDPPEQGLAHILQLAGD